VGEINYTNEIEIYKGKGCENHRIGEKFRYSEDIAHVCPWLMGCINSMIRVLQFGGALPCKYQDSENEKVIDQDGITTEFIRCPDPTDVDVVAKITQTKLSSPNAVGWS